SAGLGARSVARAVHGVRGFFRFAVREGRMATDPMENLAAPRAFKPLPRFLSPAQVESLLRAPDVTKPLGSRDRAIVETLSATGLRVSELTGLKPGDVDLQVGLLTCLGKGRKERLVPLGRVARDWTMRYLNEVRPRFARGGRAPWLFLSLRGGRLSSMGLWAIRPRPRRDRGSRALPHATRAPPLVCEPPPRARGRSALAPGHARPHGHLDHPDLHPHHARATPQALRPVPPACLTGRA